MTDGPDAHAGRHNHGCANSAPDDYDALEQRLHEQSARIKRKILVLSGKGGVGKSAVAASLAWSFAARGLLTGLLDADVSGPSAALMTGISDRRAIGHGGLTPVTVIEGLHVLSMSLILEDRDQPTIWRGPLRGSVIRQFIGDADWGPLDCLIVDLPPGTGDEPLTVAQAFPDAEGAIVVTTPQEASVAVCRKAVNFLRALRIPCLGVIENMSGFVCPHCGEVTAIFGDGGGEAMAGNMGVPFLGRLPLAPEAVRLCDAGAPLVGAASPAPLREAFEAIVARLLPR